MKKMIVMILVLFFGITASDPAQAWFWEQKKVQAPVAVAEVSQESGETAEPVKKKGLWTRIKDAFRGTKEEVKKDSKKGAKNLKEGFKEMGRDFKDAGKKIGQGVKQVPGEIKKGAKAVGKGAKEAGKDVKDSTKEAMTGDGEESGK